MKAIIHSYTFDESLFFKPMHELCNMINDTAYFITMRTCHSLIVDTKHTSSSSNIQIKSEVMDTDEFRTAYEPTSSDVPVKIEEHEVVVNDQTMQTGEDPDAK